MPRVLVTTDPTTPAAAAVLLDEQVQAVHLSDEHSVMQFIERVGWAISDAEAAEHAHTRRRRRRVADRHPNPSSGGVPRAHFAARESTM